MNTYDDIDGPEAIGGGLSRLLLRLPMASGEVARRLGVDPSAIRTLDAGRELPWRELDFVAIDTETTGLNASEDRVIEIAAVRYARGACVEEHSVLLHPGVPIPLEVQKLTGIDDDDVAQCPSFAEGFAAIAAMMERADFALAYHAPFDRAFLRAECRRARVPLPRLPWICALVLIREIDRYKPGKNLAEASKRWGIEIDRAHRALPDALAAAELLLKIEPFIPARSLFELLDHQARWSERQRGD